MARQTHNYPGNGGSTGASGAKVGGGGGKTFGRPSGRPQMPSNGYRKPVYGNVRTNMDYRSAEDTGYAAALAAYGNATAPTSPGGGTSGGGGGGGGGGGAGAPPITQAMIDAMARALGVQNGQLGYTPLPAFVGQNLPAFSAAPYNTQRQQVNQAVAADMANFATNQAATTQAVQGAFTNPYASAQVQAGPAMPTLGGSLMGTAGAAADPAMAQQVNAENAQNQGSFQDLYRVLGANAQQAQQSRMAQVAMDANYGRQTAQAQALGLRGGIANQQAQAAEAWRQAQAERHYQNSLMAYQTQVQNAQGQQGVNQANWTAQQQALQARLQPILDLISQARGPGTAGLNFDALIRALQGQGQRAA